MSFSGESGNPGYRSKPHVTDSGESDTWRDTEERKREEKRGGRREPKERKIRGKTRSAERKIPRMQATRLGERRRKPFEVIDFKGFAWSG